MILDPDDFPTQTEWAQLGDTEQNEYRRSVLALNAALLNRVGAEDFAALMTNGVDNTPGLDGVTVSEP